MVPQNGGHRGEEHRRALDGETGIGKAEAVHPGDLGKQPDHLAERQQNADQQDDDDDRVEARIRQKGCPDLLVEDDDEQRPENQENQHPHQEDPR